ncbi:MAG: hypothetical protein Q9208_007258 [Pyrenodesmia sp. 3 TL-2023]
MECSSSSGSDGSLSVSSTEKTTPPDPPQKLKQQSLGEAPQEDAPLNIYTLYAPIYYQARELCRALQAIPAIPSDRSTVELQMPLNALMASLAKLKVEFEHNLCQLLSLIESSLKDKRYYTRVPGNQPDLLFLCQDLAAQLRSILLFWLSPGEYVLVRNCPSGCRGLTRTIPSKGFLRLLPEICQDVSQHKGWDFEWLRELDGELCLFKTNTKEYILETKPADAAEDSDLVDEICPLGHLFYIVWYPDADPNHVSCHIVPEEDYHHVRPYPAPPHGSARRAQPFEMRQLAKDRAPVKCVFVYLGWLAEQRIQRPKTRQVTYFQVLLNLSTDPVSLWVIYAYHIYDWPYQWTNQLGPYTNRLYNNTGVRHKRKDPNPFCAYKSISQPAGYKDFRETYYTNVDDKVLPAQKKTHPAIAPGRPPAAPASEGTDGTDMDKDREDEPTTHGYFGLRRPFDLALLAPNIKAWTADGFDPREIKACLYSSNVRLGASLQKEPVDLRRKWEDVVSDRVDIGGLCFPHQPSPVED